MSDGAARLIALARPLGIDLAPRSRSEGMGGTGGPMAFVRTQLDGWVTDELLRPTPATEPMPSESGEYLAAHAADLAAARTLLLSDEPIVWAVDVRDPTAPLPSLLGHMQLHRVFLASALDRARVGDVGAWNDLRAAWRLARILAVRPDISSQTVSLAVARRVNAAARKLPLPPPAWFEELRTFDSRRAMMSAYQAAAWSIADRVAAENSIDASDEGFGPVARKAVDAVMAPYTRMSAADMAEAWRKQATGIASARRCDFDRAAHDAAQREGFAWWNQPARQISTPNLTAIWVNVFRFTAEREATVRALRLRAGQPPLTFSSCAGASWVYGPDGRSFTFSLKLPEPPVRGTAMPLEFALESRSGALLDARQ